MDYFHILNSSWSFQMYRVSTGHKLRLSGKLGKKFFPAQLCLANLFGENTAPSQISQGQAS